MNKNVKIAVFAVLGAVLVTVLGTSLAFFYARATNSGSTITGQTFDFGASINMSTIYRATELVPLRDERVIRAITKEEDKCIDIYDRDVCSLYQVTLSNSGDRVILTPYIITTETTYTTSNIRCQLYDTSYNAVSDVITPSNTVGTKVYMTLNSNNLEISLGSSSQTYYLVVWLTDTLSNQSADYNKVYNGTITFDAGEGGEVYVDFSA